jgi:hypothetical protein
MANYSEELGGFTDRGNFIGYPLFTATPMVPTYLPKYEEFCSEIYSMGRE